GWAGASERHRPRVSLADRHRGRASGSACSTGAWRRSIVSSYRKQPTLVTGFVTWWAAVDSNHLPPRYQHGALPVELAAQVPQPVWLSGRAENASSLSLGV